MHLHQLFLVLQVGVFVLGGDPHTHMYKYRYYHIVSLHFRQFCDWLDVTLNGCIHACITLLGVMIYFQTNLIIIIICKLTELVSFQQTILLVIVIKHMYLNIHEKITYEIVKRSSFRIHCSYYYTQLVKRTYILMSNENRDKNLNAVDSSWIFADLKQ